MAQTYTKEKIDELVSQSGLKEMTYALPRSDYNKIFNTYNGGNDLSTYRTIQVSEELGTAIYNLSIDRFFLTDASGGRPEKLAFVRCGTGYMMSNSFDMTSFGVGTIICFGGYFPNDLSYIGFRQGSVSIGLSSDNYQAQSMQDKAINANGTAYLSPNYILPLSLTTAQKTAISDMMSGGSASEFTIEFSSTSRERYVQYVTCYISVQDSSQKMHILSLESTSPRRFSFIANSKVKIYAEVVDTTHLKIGSESMGGGTKLYKHRIPIGWDYNNTQVFYMVVISTSPDKIISNSISNDASAAKDALTPYWEKRLSFEYASLSYGTVPVFSFEFYQGNPVISGFYIIKTDGTIETKINSSTAIKFVGVDLVTEL